MWYWSGAVGIAWIGNWFVLGPLMALVFGGMKWYQYRGFYYDYRLSELFKETQDS